MDISSLKRRPLRKQSTLEDNSRYRNRSSYKDRDGLASSIPTRPFENGGMDFDTTLDRIGAFGWVQLFHFAVLVITMLTGGFYTIALSFVGKAPSFTCDGKPDEDPCKVQPPCEKFVYDSSFTSIVTEWDLVCENKKYADLAQSAYMVGNFAGFLVFGYVGDKYGRLNTGIMTNLLQVFVQMSGAYVISYEQFALNRCVLGFFAGGAGLVLSTHILENAQSQWRATANTILTASFALSIALTSLWAYNVREWRTFLWTCNVFMLPFFCLVWFVPKSARWLASQGRTIEAEDILYNLGYKNGTILSRESVKLDNVKANATAMHQQTKSYGIMDMFSTPEMMRRMRILLWGWLTVGLVYFGLTVSSSSLGGNMYVNVAMNGLVEIPSAFLSSFLANRIGRNRTLAGFIGLTAVACTVVTFLPTTGDMAALQTYLALTAKMGVAAAFNIQGLYTNELLPTVIRNLGIGFCAMFSRLGAITAPILMAFFTGSSVYLVYAFMSGVYALLVLTIPETLNKPLPETVEEVEEGSTLDSLEK